MSMNRLRQATPQEQYDEVTRGSVDVHAPEQLKKKLQQAWDTNTPLVVKAGFDPTRPDLHLGHTLVLTRMRRFQSFGHTVVFLVGDFTAMIGDPSGKNVARPPLSRDEVLANAETYKVQAFKVLDPDLTRVVFNSEHLAPLGAEGMIRLASRYTLARMLEREDFKTRFRDGRPISIHEILYPLLQGYDSVALNADVELGSTDQLFNLLVGRQLMKEYGLESQVIMTGPLLEGLDARLENGVIVGNKMSKSLDNYVGISEEPAQIFGKLMSISDDLMWRYYQLLSAQPLPQIERLREEVAAGRSHPKQAKVAFAREMVSRFCGDAEAEQAAEGFERRFARRDLDLAGLPEIEVALGGAARMATARVIASAGLSSSVTAARTLIAQGAVKIDGQRVTDPKAELAAGNYVLQVGKLKVARVHLR
jgi:tyrosyl-tRNA synthetase